MKKVIYVALVLVMLLIVNGCSVMDTQNREVGRLDKKELRIVTSFYPIYIFTQNITRDINDVKVLNMTEPQTGCLHDYQLSPADMEILESADIFVANGAGMESFMKKVPALIGENKIIEASKGLKLIKDDKTGIPNPHVWVGISGAIGMVSNIGTQLAEMDTENAEAYRANTAAYIEKLEALGRKMHTELDRVEKKDIVTFHEAFPYFAKEFGLNTAAVIEREPGTEPGSRELADTIAIINKTGVRALFVEPQYSSKVARTIARETGATVYTLDPVVTGPRDGKPEDYINKMEANLEVLKEALK